MPRRPQAAAEVGVASTAARAPVIAAATAGSAPARSTSGGRSLCRHQTHPARAASRTTPSAMTPRRRQRPARGFSCCVIPQPYRTEARCLSLPLALAEDHALIRWTPRKHLFLTVGPAHPDRVHLGRRPQAEVSARALAAL